jgi:hypothetical protein
MNRNVCGNKFLERSTRSGLSARAPGCLLDAKTGRASVLICIDGIDCAQKFSAFRGGQLGLTGGLVGPVPAVSDYRLIYNDGSSASRMACIASPQFAVILCLSLRVL